MNPSDKNVPETLNMLKLLVGEEHVENLGIANSEGDQQLCRNIFACTISCVTPWDETSHL